MYYFTFVELLLRYDAIHLCAQRWFISLLYQTDFTVYLFSSSAHITDAV